MFELLLLITVIAVFTSGSFNPFIWVREIGGWIATVIGYTPKTLEYTKEMGRELKLDAERQMREEGTYQERAFNVTKKRSSQNAERFFNPKIQESKARQEELLEELSKL